MYFQSRRFHLSRYEMAVAYMAFGGIPYYLSYFRKGYSFEQNTDMILCLMPLPIQNKEKQLLKTAILVYFLTLLGIEPQMMSFLF